MVSIDVASGLCTVNGSTAIIWVTGMKGQMMPQSASVVTGISSAFRYAAAAALRSRKGRPRAALLSFLTEVSDYACDIESRLRLV